MIENLVGIVIHSLEETYPEKVFLHRFLFEPQRVHAFKKAVIEIYERDMASCSNKLLVKREAIYKITCDSERECAEKDFCSKLLADVFSMIKSL